MKKYIAPLVLFVFMGLLLAYGLNLDPRKIPSPLIGKPLPAFSLPTVADPARQVSRDELKGRAYLLNVWASWCVACRQEHPLLVELARNKLVTIIGLNYKDKREDALGWLASLGDPYEFSLADTDGRLGIDLGVYGVPETFVVGREGTILYKMVGPVTPANFESVLKVEIDKALMLK